jgi:hypothetical protein
MSQFNFNIKEPYKTALILAATTSVVVGAAYILMPDQWRKNVQNFVFKNIVSKFKKKDISATNK